MIAIRRLTRVTYPFIIHVTPQSNLFTLVRSQDARFTECLDSRISQNIVLYNYKFLQIGNGTNPSLN